MPEGEKGDLPLDFWLDLPLNYYQVLLGFTGLQSNMIC